MYPKLLVDVKVQKSSLICSTNKTETDLPKVTVSVFLINNSESKF